MRARRAGRGIAGAVVVLLTPLGAGATQQAPGGSQASDPALEARSAVGPDTIRVGDVVPVAVRVRVAPGQQVAWPDTLALDGTDVENAARVRVREDTLDDGRIQRTAVYTVTPWRTGELALPAVRLRVSGGGEVGTTATVSLPSLRVESVLPADTAGVEPMPAKGVLGPNWAVWPILLALLLLAALVAAAIAWLRRRRPTAVPVGPAVSPREVALARLDRAREDGLIERGEMRELYTRTSEAVRAYLADLDPGWGEDLTTTELLGRVRSRAGPSHAAALADVLAPADQVKFARSRPGPDEAIGDWERTRAWVADFDGPPQPTGQEEAA